MIRRVKADVHALPPKIRRHIVLDISPARLTHITQLLSQSDALRNCMVTASPATYLELQAQKDAVFSKLFLRTCDVKIPGVVARVTQLLRRHEHKRLLVFAHHLHMLDAVQALAVRLDVSYVRVDGRTPAATRQARVDIFQAKDARIAILSLAVAGAGLTLTAADVVLFAELSWVPTVLSQAEDRAHRIGRVGEVVIEYVVAPGTIDDLMWSVVRGKVGVLNRAVDGAQEKRRLAFDVSSTDKRIRLSEMDMQAAVSEAVLGGQPFEEEKNDTEDVVTPASVKSTIQQPP